MRMWWSQVIGGGRQVSEAVGARPEEVGIWLARPACSGRHSLIMINPSHRKAAIHPSRPSHARPTSRERGQGTGEQAASGAPGGSGGSGTGGAAAAGAASPSRVTTGPTSLRDLVTTVGEKAVAKKKAESSRRKSWSMGWKPPKKTEDVSTHHPAIGTTSTMPATPTAPDASSPSSPSRTSSTPDVESLESAAIGLPPVPERVAANLADAAPGGCGGEHAGIQHARTEHAGIRRGNHRRRPRLPRSVSTGARPGRSRRVRPVTEGSTRDR